MNKVIEISTVEADKLRDLDIEMRHGPDPSLVSFHGERVGCQLTVFMTEREVEDMESDTDMDHWFMSDTPSPAEFTVLLDWLLAEDNLLTPDSRDAAMRLRDATVVWAMDWDREDQEWVIQPVSPCVPGCLAAKSLAMAVDIFYHKNYVDPRPEGFARSHL